MPPRSDVLTATYLRTEFHNGRHEFVFELSEESINALRERSRIRFKEILLETVEVIRVTSPRAGGIHITICMADDDLDEAQLKIDWCLWRARAVLVSRYPSVKRFGKTVGS